jgi:uncharacterized protein
MHEGAALLLLVAGALVASVVSAVAGFGGAVTLLPVLTLVFGVRDAVPILTVTQLVGNASQVWFNRREVRWPVVGWFAVGSVPLGVLGGIVFATAPLPVLTRAIGAFLLLAVACRRLAPVPARPMPRWAFAPVGAGSSFVSAVAGTAGPLAAPFFLAFGLVKGAYIGTEAATAVVTHATKIAAYGTAALMTARGVVVGLLLGAVMVTGTYLGKRLVDRVSERAFVLVVEAVLVAGGVYFIVA